MSKPREPNPYQEAGYADRNAYIKLLANSCGVPHDKAFALAELLGPSEDFDGLVAMLEDFHL